MVLRLNVGILVSSKLFEEHQHRLTEWVVLPTICLTLRSLECHPSLAAPLTRSILLKPSKAGEWMKLGGRDH